MSQLQSILEDSKSGILTFLFDDRKESIDVNEVKEVQFLESPWYCIWDVSNTRIAGYVKNLLVFSMICSLLNFLLVSNSSYLIFFTLYLWGIVLAITALFFLPKKLNKLKITSTSPTIEIKNPKQQQISQLYQSFKSKLPFNGLSGAVLMETKTLKSTLLIVTFSAYFIGIFSLFVSKGISTIQLIIAFFYCIMLLGSLFYSKKYQTAVKVYLESDGFRFEEIIGKYSGQSHIIKASMLDRITMDPSQVIGLVRKGRKAVVSNTNKKSDDLVHYNRMDLHFMHQPYLPVKPYRNFGPFFVYYLNETLQLMKNKQMKVD